MNPFDIFKDPDKPKAETIVLPAIPVPKSLKKWYEATMAQIKKDREMY